MPIVNITNADTLFDALNECLISRGLSWSNVMRYMSDNCNLMKGENSAYPYPSSTAPCYGHYKKYWYMLQKCDEK